MKSAALMIGLALTCALPSVALAQTSPKGAAPIQIRWVKKPIWSRTPTEDEILGAYPYRNSKLAPTGSAVIVCQVTDQGLLAPCMVRSEDPQYAGFGRSALAVAKFMQLAPRGGDGQPTAGAYIAVPLVFQLPPEPAASAPAPR